MANQTQIGPDRQRIPQEAVPHLSDAVIALNDVSRLKFCQSHLQPADVAVKVLCGRATEWSGEGSVAGVERVHSLDVITARSDPLARPAADNDVINAAFCSQACKIAAGENEVLLQRCGCTC
jgi:hypothetical protein